MVVKVEINIVNNYFVSEFNFRFYLYIYVCSKTPVLSLQKNQILGILKKVCCKLHKTVILYYTDLTVRV